MRVSSTAIISSGRTRETGDHTDRESAPLIYRIPAPHLPTMLPSSKTELISRAYIVILLNALRKDGATENARNEISAPSKMQVVKIRDMKMRHHNAWHENTRHENTGKEKARHENTRHENAGNENSFQYSSPKVHEINEIQINWHHSLLPLS